MVAERIAPRLRVLPRGEGRAHFPRGRFQRACTTKQCGDCPGCRTRRAWADGRFAHRRKAVQPDAWTWEQDAWLRERGGARPLAELTETFNDTFQEARSVSALRIRAKRLGLSLWVHGVSLQELERVFGLDHRAIVRWWLRPGLLASERWSGRGPNDGWWVEPAELERFVRDCGWAYDWRRIPRDHALRPLAELAHRCDRWLTLTEAYKTLGYASPGPLLRWRRLIPFKRRAGASGQGDVMIRARDLAGIREAIDAATLANRAAMHLHKQRKTAAYRRGWQEGRAALLEEMRAPFGGAAGG